MGPWWPTTALALDPDIPIEQRQKIAARLGVNDPAHIQYLRWLLGDDWMRWDVDGDGLADRAFLLPLDADGDGEPDPPGTRLGILRGDFGRSFFTGKRPVLEVIGERIPATLELGISALGVGLLLGLPIGILAAVWRGKWFDSSTRVMAVVFNAVPISGLV
jgi:ABC-type dipeptide/oligopeptide/nickel transport system permease component